MDVAIERSYATPLANSTLLPMLLWALSYQKNSPKTQTKFFPEYDYIIIGAGSAGSVVASRLSEEKCVKVLLLEAGGPAPIISDVPAIARWFLGSNIDWQYETVPQKHTGAGLRDRRLQFPAGKAMGGSSVWAGMIYSRGNKKNYDDWAQQGAVGWSYKEVLPYFKKLENNKERQGIDRHFHGYSGPLDAERPPYSSSFKDAVVEAAKSFGFPIVDSNGRQQKGFYDQQATLRKGQRLSTAKAYLVPAEDRINLHIVDGAFATKILVENGRAIGVEFDHDGYKYNVSAKREVIVSSGAINTPKLLLLSGIGPQDELDKLKIPLVADLPVGKNLQDHLIAFVGHTVSGDIASLEDRIQSPDAIKMFVDERKGPLTSPQTVTNVAFLSNTVHQNRKTVPDHELYFMESTTVFSESELNAEGRTYQDYLDAYGNQTKVWCLSQQLNPKSRGTVTLKSNDPYDPPLIDPNYYDHPQDITDVVEGMKTCSKILSSAPLLKLGSQPMDSPFPGCEDSQADQDIYFACQAKTIAMTASHQSGTSKMGDPKDPTAVVDPQLKVIGIEGLRVVDASVMPIIPSGNINIPTIMIAEKASDMIKKTIVCGPLGS